MKLHVADVAILVSYLVCMLVLGWGWVEHWLNSWGFKFIRDKTGEWKWGVFEDYSTVSKKTKWVFGDAAITTAVRVFKSFSASMPCNCCK